MAIAAVLRQLQRAQALHQAGRTGEAWTILAPLRAAIDAHGQGLRLYALVAQAAGRPAEAIAALERVAALEGEPPEIVGALADLLGKAGRHQEALRQWDRLAARHPEIPDVHLNRAIAAGHAGLHQRAVQAADAGLERFPGHPRLLAVKAMALKNAGRVEESVTLFEAAVRADPDRALTRHNQGVALRAACRFGEACEAFAASARLGMRGAQFHANWAAAALEAGRVAEAEDLYAKALAEDPAHQESLKGLTRLKIEYRGGEHAFDHYRRSVEARGGSPQAWADWLNALIGHQRPAEAAEVASRALAAHPDIPELRALKSFAQGLAGDAASALAELEAELRERPSDPALLASIPQVALRAGQPDRAAAILERQVAANPHDQTAWSLLSIAWRLLDDPREHWLCDYERLVMVTEVRPPGGEMEPADYAVEVAALLDPLHVTLAAPGDQSLRGGTQTSGALFDRPDPAIRRFRDAVRLAAEAAVASLPDDPGHPFLSRKTPRLGFHGSWSVRLHAGGHHVPHMHHEGWMSSAYYARVPDCDAEGRRSREGWIQFGEPPDSFGLDLEPRRFVEPQPGRLVLFPSYM